jgi:hypothetical protein
MTTITTRAGKGSPLTNNEVDANFNNLNTDKIETLTSTDGSVAITGTGSSRNLSVTTTPNAVVGPASATDNAITRYDGTTGKLIQNSTVTLSDVGDIANVNSVVFDTTPGTLPTVEGAMYWDVDKGAISYVMQGGDVVNEIGESQYIYIQASANITKGQVVMFTGAVGGSGTPTGAPATGVTDGTYIMGIAAEDITNGTSGFVQTFGILKPVNTTGFATGTILWYDPAVAGGLTSTKPSAPNVKVQVAAVTAGNSSGGALIIRVTPGSELGATDSNVLFGSLANGNLLVYNATAGYWVNANLTAGAGISVTNGAGSVSIANTGVTSITGTANQITASGSTGSVTLSLPSSINVNTTGTSAGVVRTVTGTTSAELVRGNMADNDQFRILVGGTATNAGYAEIATADDGTEPIYVRQYTGVFTTLVRTATLLDGSGNTSFPGSVTANGVTLTGNTGTVTSVGGTGTVNGLTLTGTVTSSGNLTLGGTLSGVSLSTQVTGTLPIANGGTGATTASGARTNLGATTLGANLFTVPNPGAITFPRFNADNTVSSLSAADFRTAIGAGTGNGTVTSVTGTSPVASSGGATPAISLASGYGDTQNPYASKTANFFLAAPNGTSGVPTFRAIVAADIPTLNQNTTGTAGNVTGTVAIANGGTGATTAASARTNLGATTVGSNFFTLTNPSAIRFPRINADNTVSALSDSDFRTAIGAGTGSGTVTSVSGTGTASGLTLSGTVTSSGSLTLSGTVNSLAAGTYAISISGSAATLTTGRTISATGDISYTSGSFNGSGNVTGTATLATVNSNVGTFGSASAVPIVTVNAKGLVTAVSTAAVSGGQYFGSAAVKAIAYNSQTIAENVTVTAGNNGLSAGPITVNSGFTVTVESGANWVIV